MHSSSDEFMRWTNHCIREKNLMYKMETIHLDIGTEIVLGYLTTYMYDMWCGVVQVGW